MQHLDEVLELSRQRPRGPLSPWFETRLREQVGAGLFLPPSELQAVGKRLVQQLAEYREQAGVSTAVLGMSGGVDSAVTAALLKEAGWRVVGYTLPIEQDPVETERGVEACHALGIEHLQLDLSEQYHCMVAGLGSLDEKLRSGDTDALRTRRGNMRARLRMITLYDQAHRWGGLVASTDNFSELGAGFWTLHGDVGDLTPVQSLLKSWEVPWMAHAYGVPESTWRAKPTDGLGIGEGDEAQIGATYLEWDVTVFAVLDVLRRNPSLSAEQIPDVLCAGDDPVAVRAIAAVLRRLRTTWFKRMNPIALDHPKSDRLSMLDMIDDRLFRPAVLRDDRALTSFSGEIVALGQRLANELADKKIRVVTAESCTAGLLGACIAATPRSSSVLEGSFVAYSPSMKIDALGVPDALIQERTVYDPEVARAMAEGALQRAKGAGLAIAITGVAGPEPDEGKPVGLVYIATLHRSGTPQVTECHFSGQPREIVAETVRKALNLGLEALD
ncbi:NAD(+) synthase [Silicimonas algicola]|uniref:NH(3)-dependent NAD(+) synthetase n=1 Tax=Silicimonas algicola TaxID=1826607 RepID=A0A316FVX9_9RHOB|nr:NAD(+) synthase [Silicimonas algicola]AZQ67591.1 NAD(+) synthase [Silicimonas algicola]PWK52748.1 NH(3)-dependent NAD(+) synthetase [Silicimonas algicola]